MRFDDMLRLLESGEYDRAADDASKTLWARETPARAARVEAAFRSASK